ncbi:family 43 glycosylhydrolase [Actinocrispum wychmicini]|uniref:Glycosyl hydrolase family 32 n=1 Tax=Actinocrispum wychmicini TaxID=1213861 RepID=A0A4R2JUQ5_9PSEU|nr:family 43 glycosylhydrolase [Actinocrispum wychmicini]TCO62782.1 glycosyl hydrolase family 32 [Actinocrispum wychmicini]
MRRIGTLWTVAALLGAALPAAAATGAGQVGATPFVQIYDPSEQSPWYINDHTFVQDAQGTWHLFGITHTEPAAPDDEDTFAHATAPSLNGPWTKRAPALSVDPAYGETHLWAPHVIRNGSTYYMFYAGGGADPARHAINLATSTDLYTWTRNPGGPLFRDGAVARDPYVVRVGDQWVMYYTATSEPSGGNHVVAVRTSVDLVHWSDRSVAFADPTTGSGGGDTESPFVVNVDGAWYLFVGPRGGYVGTDVFRSPDPFHFSVDQLAGHVFSHAAEVINADGRWWISHAGWGQRGVWLAGLDFGNGSQQYAVEASSDPSDRVVIVSGFDGRQEVFAGGPDQVWGRYQTTRNGQWSDWFPFGGPKSATLSAARDVDGRLELFASGEGRVDRRAQSAPNTWDDWANFGTAAHDMTVAQNADGRLEIFASGSVGIFHRWQTAPGGTWAEWEAFGGPADSVIATGRDANGRIEVMAAAGSTVYRRRQAVASGGWAGFDQFGSVSGVKHLALNRRPDGALELVAGGSAGTSRRTQSGPSGEWTGWTAFGGPPSARVHIGRNADGRMEVFAAGDFVTQHRWENGSGWSAWENFGSGASGWGFGTNADGRIEIVAGTGSLAGRYQVAPSGGWSTWTPVGGPTVD